MPKEINPIIQVNNISVKYGYVQALEKVSIDAMEGELVSIIGSNGAGKNKFTSYNFRFSETGARKYYLQGSSIT